MPELHWQRFETHRSPKGHGMRARARGKTIEAWQDASGRWWVRSTDRPQTKRDFKTWPEARKWAGERASANPDVAVRPQVVHSRGRRQNPSMVRRPATVLMQRTIVVLEDEDGEAWVGTIEEFWAAQDEAVWPLDERQSVELELRDRGSTSFDGGAGPLSTLRIKRNPMPKRARNTDKIKFPALPKNAKFERIGHFDLAIVPVAENGRGSTRSYGVVARKKAEALLVYDRRGGDPIAMVDIPLDERGRYWVYKIERGEPKKMSSSYGATVEEALAPLGALANPRRRKNPSRGRKSNGARGRKKNGAGLGAFLGSLIGSALGMGVASMPLAVIGSIGGGAIGGHLGAPRDRRRRGSIGGAAGGALLGPIGAGVGGYIGGREPDKQRNPKKKARARAR